MFVLYDQIFRGSIKYSSFSSASVFNFAKEIEDRESKNGEIRYDETCNIKAVNFR